MKNLKIAIVSLMIAIVSINTLHAQEFYWGPRLGLNVSGLTKTSYAKSRARMNFGLHGGYKINDVIGVQLEALYSLQGASSHNSNVKTSLNYLKVPILAKIYLIGGLNVEAGIGFNWLLYAAEKGVTSAGEEYTINIYDRSRIFDFTIPVGLNYQFKRLFDIGVRYDISTVRASDDSNNRAKSSNWSIHVGVRF